MQERFAHWPAIARREMGVVTNVGYAHVEFFGFHRRRGAGQTRIDRSPARARRRGAECGRSRVARFREVHPGRSDYVRISRRRRRACDGRRFVARRRAFRAVGVDFETTLAGRHGCSIFWPGSRSRAFRDPAGSLASRRTFTMGKMRGERIERNGIVVWNDCYNANPEAMRAMIDVLARNAARRIAVVGEMLELGQSADPLHRGVGEYRACRGIDVVIGIRGAARFIVDEAVRAGLSDSAAFFFEDPVEAGDLSRDTVREGDARSVQGIARRPRGTGAGEGGKAV